MCLGIKSINFGWADFENQRPAPLPRQRTAVLATSRSDIETYIMETEITNPLVHPQQTTLTLILCLRSDDTVESPPPPRLTRFTRDEEFTFFTTSLISLMHPLQSGKKR
jgi:hypothetical protein